MESDVVIQTQLVDTLYVKTPWPAHRNFAELIALFGGQLDADPHSETRWNLLLHG